VDEKNVGEELKIKLKRYHKDDIVITRHALMQAVFRSIDLSEVKENILIQSVYHMQGSSKVKGNVIVILGTARPNAKGISSLLMETVSLSVIKINRRWQHIIEKNAKI